MSVAPLLMLEPDIKAVGLPITQGMVIGTGFYWDLNDASRASARTFWERFKRIPTQYQASVYAGVRRSLTAVAAAGTVDSERAIEKMREMPAYYFFEPPPAFVGLAGSSRMLTSFR